MICPIMIFWAILSRQMLMKKCCCSARMVSGDFVHDLFATNTHKKCHLRASVVIFWRLHRCICGDLVHPSLPVSVCVVSGLCLCVYCVCVSVRRVFLCLCVRVCSLAIWKTIFLYVCVSMCAHYNCPISHNLACVA